VQQPSRCAKVQIIATVFVASLAQSCGGNGSLMAHAARVRVQRPGLCRVRSGFVFVGSREAVSDIDEAKLGVDAESMG
jgi:hypothetical protein